MDRCNYCGKELDFEYTACAYTWGVKVLFCEMDCANKASKQHAKYVEAFRVTRVNGNLESWISHIYNYYVGE